jgi:hypothetical protein
MFPGVETSASESFAVFAEENGTLYCPSIFLLGRREKHFRG